MPHPVSGPDLVPSRATPLDRARDLAVSLGGTLRLAQALAVAGRRIDLGGLEGPIGLLCAKSLDLPPEEGRQMRILLIELLGQVDALSETMRAPRGGDAAPG